VGAILVHSAKKFGFRFYKNAERFKLQEPGLGHRATERPSWL